jgi:hypothetical protein
MTRLWVHILSNHAHGEIYEPKIIKKAVPSKDASE